MIYGVNSIAVWVFSQLGMKTLMAIKQWTPAPQAGAISGRMNGSLAFAVLFDLFWLGAMCILYRRRIYIKF